MVPSGCQLVGARPGQTATKTMPVLRYRMLLEA